MATTNQDRRIAVICQAPSTTWAMVFLVRPCFDTLVSRNDDCTHDRDFVVFRIKKPRAEVPRGACPVPIQVLFGPPSGPQRAMVADRQFLSSICTGGSVSA